jgi:hypothetical protein
MRQMQTFFGDDDHHVGAHRNPYLCLYGVLPGAQEGLDTQMLLDPSEEQFDLPALAVQLRDHLGLEGQVVGQTSDELSRLAPDHHAALGGRLVLAGIEHGEHPRLVANDERCGSTHRVRVTPLQLGIAPGAGHEECLRLVNDEEPGEVQVAPVHKAERPGLDHQSVQHVDFVRLAVGDLDETGNRAEQVEQRAQLDGRAGAAKWCPRIDRNTQIDGGRIEGVDRGIQSQKLDGVE